MSPSSGNLDETISTLKFANRAKRVRNNAEINEISDESALLRQYREEIDRLKRELTQLKEASNKSNPSGATPAPAAAASGAPTANELALKAQIEQLTRLILTSQTVKQEKSGHTLPPEALPYFKPKAGATGSGSGAKSAAGGAEIASPKTAQQKADQSAALKESPHIKALPVLQEPPLPPETDPGYLTAMKLVRPFIQLFVFAFGVSDRWRWLFVVICGDVW